MNRHLIFRCAICRATTSLEAHWSDQRAAEVACASCHELYQLDADRDRAESDDAYLEQVRQYAVENRIDLASAYSVAEGILPRNKVRTLPAGSPEIPRTASSAARSLVLLTMLILSLGFLAREMRILSPSVAAPGDGSSQASVPGVNRVKLVPVSYQVSPDGRLTMVTAPDPRGALLAFCQHESNIDRLQAVSIAPGEPVGSAEWRTGVVREAGHDLTFAWITIRRDARTGLWTIGDGDAPVELDRGRQLPVGAEFLTF